MVTSVEQLKTYFETEKTPTNQQFLELLDSYYHRFDDIQSLLGATAEVSEAKEGNVNDKYMTPFLTKEAIQALTRLSVLTDLSRDVQQLIDVAVNNLINNAPGTMDTLGEIAQVFNNDPNAINSLISSINNRYTKAEIDAFFEGTVSGKKQTNWDRVTGKPSTFLPSTHNHDERYYTEQEMQNLLAQKASVNHVHTASELGINDSIILTGNSYLGNPNADNRYRITHNANKTSYRVLATLYTDSSDSLTNNDTIVTIGKRTSSYFDVLIREVEGGSENIGVAWMMFKTPQHYNATNYKTTNP